jgi:hypothetical protein
MSTAVECIRSIFPLCAIETIRVDKSPLRVTITASTSDMELPIWSGKQQNLFEKYRVKRRKTMKMIVANLETTRDNLRAHISPVSDIDATLSPIAAEHIPPAPLIREVNEVPVKS